MSYKLKKIDRQWRMASVSDPYFKYDEDGLKFSFMIFIKDSERENDLNTYMQINNLNNEQYILGDVLSDVPRIV